MPWLKKSFRDKPSCLINCSSSFDSHHNHSSHSARVIFVKLLQIAFGEKQHKQSLLWLSWWFMIGTLFTSQMLSSASFPSWPLCSRLLWAFNTPSTELPQGSRVSSFTAMTFSTILTRLASEHLPTSKVALLLTPQIFFIIYLCSVFFSCMSNSIRLWWLRIFCTKESPSVFRTKHLAELLCKRINHFKQWYH